MSDTIRCSQRHVSVEHFVVLLGNSITKYPIPCTKQLIDVYEKYKASTISFEAVHKDKVERYGIISDSKVEKDIHRMNLHQTLQ